MDATLPFFACGLDGASRTTRAVSGSRACRLRKAETIAHIGQPSLSLMIVVKES